MGSSLHSIQLKKVYSLLGGVRSCVVRIDDEFSIGLPDLGVAPNSKWTEDICSVICPIEFGTWRTKINSLKTRRMPNYGWRHFVGQIMCLSRSGTVSSG
jgi:hypothetical protein